MTKPDLALPTDYPQVLATLKTQIRTAQRRAQRTVSTQLLELYWTIGNAILDRQHNDGWGAKVIDRLAVDLSAAFPDSKGFSRSNIHYMRALALAWPGTEFVPQAVGQIPWGHVRLLLCAGRNDTVVRYSLGSTSQPVAVAGYTYDALPPDERAALPAEEQVAAVLAAALDLHGRQQSLSEYLNDRPLTRNGDPEDQP